MAVEHGDIEPMHLREVAVEQFVHRQNLEHYRRLLADPDEKSLSWRVVTRGFDDHRPCARAGVAPGVCGDVVDGVGRCLRCVDDDVAHERAVESGDIAPC